jgi:hypothetical protein
MEGPTPMEISPPPAGRTREPEEKKSSEIQSIERGREVRCTVEPSRAICTPLSVLLVSCVAFSVRVPSQTQPSKRMPRECPCGWRLSGRAPRVNGVEVCKPCEMRAYRGLPQLHKDVRAPAPAAGPAIARRSGPKDPLGPSILPPMPDVMHATRMARAAAAMVHDESKEVHHSPEPADLLMGDEPMSDAPVVPPSSDLSCIIPDESIARRCRTHSRLTRLDGADE